VVRLQHSSGARRAKRYEELADRAKKKQKHEKAQDR